MMTDEPDLDHLDPELSSDLMDVSIGSTSRQQLIYEPEMKGSSRSSIGLGGQWRDLPEIFASSWERQEREEETTMRAKLSLPPPDQRDDELAEELNWADPQQGREAKRVAPVVQNQSMRSGKEEKADGQQQQQQSGQLQLPDVEEELRKGERIVEGTKENMAQMVQLQAAALEDYKRTELVFSKSKRDLAIALASKRPELVLPKPAQRKYEAGKGLEQQSMDMADDTKTSAIRKPPKGTHIDSLQDTYMSMLGRQNERLREAEATRMLGEALKMAQRVNEGSDDSMSYGETDEEDWRLRGPVIDYTPAHKLARVQ